MRPETKFWNSIKNKIPGHVCRIENGVSVGMPDINICVQGIEIWVELKVAEDGPFGPKVLVRKQQRIWCLDRSNQAGKVFVVSLCSDLDRILVWKYPEIQFEKYNDTYQRITSAAHCSKHRNEFIMILAYMLGAKV